ncbi:MAG: hypothetical protein FWD89_02610 [Firmicutes bacterium]|nr:hypothetical protein [Bacillota bacterium]
MFKFFKDSFDTTAAQLFVIEDNRKRYFERITDIKNNMVLLLIILPFALLFSFIFPNIWIALAISVLFLTATIFLAVLPVLAIYKNLNNQIKFNIANKKRLGAIFALSRLYRVLIRRVKYSLILIDLAFVSIIAIFILAGLELTAAAVVGAGVGILIFIAFLIVHNFNINQFMIATEEVSVRVLEQIAEDKIYYENKEELLKAIETQEAIIATSLSKSGKSYEGKSFTFLDKTELNGASVKRIEAPKVEAIAEEVETIETFETIVEETKEEDYIKYVPEEKPEPKAGAAKKPSAPKTIEEQIAATEKTYSENSAGKKPVASDIVGVKKLEGDYKEKKSKEIATREAEFLGEEEVDMVRASVEHIPAKPAAKKVEEPKEKTIDVDDLLGDLGGFSDEPVKAEPKKAAAPKVEEGISDKILLGEKGLEDLEGGFSTDLLGGMDFDLFEIKDEEEVEVETEEVKVEEPKAVVAAEMFEGGGADISELLDPEELEAELEEEEKLEELEEEEEERKRKEREEMLHDMARTVAQGGQEARAQEEELRKTMADKKAKQAGDKIYEDLMKEGDKKAVEKKNNRESVTESKSDKELLDAMKKDLSGIFEDTGIDLDDIFKEDKFNLGKEKKPVSDDDFSIDAFDSDKFDAEMKKLQARPPQQTQD